MKNAPLKQGLEYFPHEVDASTDPKLEPAVMRFGAAGYAFYFLHLEYCYRSSGFEIDVSLSEAGLEMRAAIVRKLRLTSARYEEILQTFLRSGAFDADHYRETGMLTSRGIHRRAAVVTERRERDAARRSHDRRRRSDNGKSGDAQSPTGSTPAPVADNPTDAIASRAQNDAAIGVCASVSAKTGGEQNGGNPCGGAGVSAKTEGAQRGIVLSRESTAQHSIAQNSIEQHSKQQNSTKENRTESLTTGERAPPSPESAGTHTLTLREGELTMQNSPVSPACTARGGGAVPGNTPEDAPARCPPTQKQVADFCRERKSPVNPERFYDYYTARGWLAGAGKITDWKACLRSWEHTGGVLREAAGRIEGAKSINGPDADKLKKMIEEKFMRKKEEDCP